MLAAFRGMMLRSLGLMLLFLLGLGAVCQASVGGSISGTVKDQTGRLVANASVTLRETGTNVTFRGHSDSNGYYRRLAS
jgi:Carboxypeptidase regulatory-like domain